MWYKIAQQQPVDIASQSGQSSLNQNTGIYANYAEMQAMSKALKEGTFAEIDTPSGKILVLHGSQGPNGEFCGQIAPGQSLCGDEFTAWRQQKGYNADQVLTCEGGLCQILCTMLKLQYKLAFLLHQILTIQMHQCLLLYKEHNELLR